MRKFVLLKSISKQYIELQKKVRRNNQVLDSLKLLTSVIIFLLIIWVYGYFVNISSTKWYFLRQEMKNLEETKFTHSITQLDILTMERDIWNEIQTVSVFNEKKVTIRDKIVRIKTQDNKMAMK